MMRVFLVCTAVVGFVVGPAALARLAIPPWYQCGASCCDEGCRCHPKAQCRHDDCNLCSN